MHRSATQDGGRQRFRYVPYHIMHAAGEQGSRGTGERVRFTWSQDGCRWLLLLLGLLVGSNVALLFAKCPAFGSATGRQGWTRHLQHSLADAVLSGCWPEPKSEAGIPWYGDPEDVCIPVRAQCRHVTQGHLRL